MMTVRFPTGFSIQYNAAQWASRRAEYTDLYTKEGGQWVAQVPNSCVIELVMPCSMSNAMLQTKDVLDTAIAAARERRFGYWDRSKVNELKRELARFNGKTGVWK